MRRTTAWGRVFGAYKYERHRLPGISQRRASGLAQAKVMKSLSNEDSVQHRASRKLPDGVSSDEQHRVTTSAFGYFHRLPRCEAEALVEFARLVRDSERKVDQADVSTLDAFRVARRKSNSELELESLIKQFALGLSFFDRYKVSSHTLTVACCMLTPPVDTAAGARRKVEGGDEARARQPVVDTGEARLAA